MGPTIDFQALVNGKRIRSCSDRARLMFPYLFMGSNSYGRLELDIEVINEHIFVGFSSMMSSDEFWSIIQEYRTNHLLFVYRSGQRLFGQWYVKEGYLPTYKAKRDLSLPAPPEDQYQSWLNSYKSREISKIPAFLREVPEISRFSDSREEKSSEEECSVEKQNTLTPPTPSGEGDVSEGPTPINHSKAEIGREFDQEFWPLVWRKVGRGAALTQYRKARKTTPKEKLILAAKLQGPGILAYAEQNSITPILVATWLNQGRYDDEDTVGPANRARASPAKDDDEDWSFMDDPKPEKREHKHV